MGFDVYCTHCRGNVSELIYKRDLVRKCPRCGATLSQDEVEKARHIGCGVMSWFPTFIIMAVVAAALGRTDAAWMAATAVGLVVFCSVGYVVMKYYYRWQ